MKRCLECGQTLPLDAFYVSSAGKRQSYCKPCSTARATAWRRKNRGAKIDDIDRDVMRWSDIAAALGITTQGAHWIGQNALRKLRKSGLLDEFFGDDEAG